MISIIFQKNSEDISECSGELDGNYIKVMNVLSSHTTIHHFSTLVPYKKVFANVLAAINEQIGLRTSNFSNEKAIIDTVISTELHKKIE